MTGSIRLHAEGSDLFFLAQVSLKLVWKGIVNFPKNHSGQICVPRQICPVNNPAPRPRRVCSCNGLVDMTAYLAAGVIARAGVGGSDAIVGVDIDIGVASLDGSH